MSKVKYYSLWICLICIIVFAIQLMIPSFTDLFVLNSSSYIQPWRFVTSIFLHGSPTHLLYNLFALFFFGLILEKTVGSKRFLWVFFTSGILANIISINFYTSSLGASGAIMGILGALTVIRPLMNVWAFGVIMPMAAAAVVWVLGDVIGIFMPDNVGHIAHLSGIFFGLIFGIVFRTKHHKQKKTHRIEVPEHIMRRWETLYMD